jgi:hypothetical protein
MALLTTQKLFIDVDRGVAYSAWNNFSQAPTPVFYAGDTALLELYLVRSTGRGEFPMESVAFPASTITAAVGTPGGTPAASGTSWSAISTPAATYSAPTLSIPTSAIGGSYILTLTNTSPALTAVTAALTLTATASDIEAAIEAAVNAQSGWSLANAIVTQTGSGQFNVTVSATNSTTVYSLTVAVTSSLVGPAGYTGEVAFTGGGVGTLLGSALQVNSTFEVEVLDTTKYQTYLQIPCILKKQVVPPPA